MPLLLLQTIQTPSMSHWTLSDQIAVIASTIAFLQFCALLWTIGVMRKTATRQLRAYVSSQTNYHLSNFNENVPLTMQYTIINNGQTPAYNVRHTSKVDILPYPLPLNYSFPQLRELQPSSHHLPQGGSFIGGTIAHRLFTREEINDAVTNNGSRIYIFGIITYIDVFKKKRKTKFCSSAIGSPNLALIGSSGSKEDVFIVYEISEKHNEAD